MIGTHTVEVFTDRVPAGWSAPLFTNPYFDVDLAGWQTSPFSPAWTWLPSGQATFTTDGSTGSALNRSSAGVVARPPNVDTYRARYTLTVPVESDVFVKLHFGTTQEGAAQGPFWKPGEAVEQWAASHLAPGTHVIEYTYDQTRPGTPDPKYVWLGVSFAVAPVPATPGVAYKASVSSLVVDYRTTRASADLTCLVDEVRIVHGRDDTTGQPDAPAATIDLTTGPGAPLPAAVDVGAIVLVTTATPERTSTRFVGRVTDVSLSWDDAGEDTPDAGVGQIVAVGMLADLARRIVGAEPWPVELDGARVARVANLAGMPLDPRWSDPGTVSVIARDVDAQPALDVMHGTAESAGGIVWTTRGGEVRYADANHRRGAAPALALDACDVLVTPTWRRDLAGLVNQIAITYGDDGAGERPTYTTQDAASVTKYGRYAASVTTELAALADAQAMGSLVVVRNSSPVWVMSSLPVDVQALNDSRTAALLGLDMHSLVSLTGLPGIGTAPTSTSLWVEGWREVLAWGVHEIELAVSGYCRTSPPPYWDDVSPEWTWNTIPADLTWDAMSCLGPQPDRGRWNDVPATTRWDELPPATTWDSWVTTPAALQTEGT